MNLLKRIKNLWRLSGNTVPENYPENINRNGCEKIELANQRPGMAKIIKMSDPLEQILKKEE